MYQLFVFFMVTDPRTTVRTRRGRMIVVAIVALVETLIRLAGDYQIALLRRSTCRATSRAGDGGADRDVAGSATDGVLTSATLIRG